MASLIEPWFLFALVWSVGATRDGDSRKKFDRYLRERISEEKVCAAFVCARPPDCLSCMGYHAVISVQLIRTAGIPRPVRVN